MQMKEKVKELKKQGKELLRNREYARAIETFNRVIEDSPGDIYSLDILGFLYYMTGQFEEAKRCCEKSISLKPDNYYAFKGLGLCLVRLKKVDEGIEMIKKSIALNPCYFDSYYDLGVTYMEIKDFTQARSYFNKALEIDRSREKDIYKVLKHLDKMSNTQHTQLI